MTKTIIFIILISSTLAVADKLFWTANKSNFYSSFLQDAVDEKIKEELQEEWAKNRYQLLYGILNSDYFEDYSFTKMLGRGSFGTVLEAKFGDDKVSVKIMFDNSRYSNCDDAEKNYNQLKVVDGIKYLIETSPPKKFAKYSQYACAIIMERAFPTESVMFSWKDTQEELTFNTERFVRFAERLIEGFYTINYIGKFYHADVKPDNIMYIKDNNNEVEPRIIDFDLTFKKLTPNYNPGFIIYTITYRPPELKRLVPNTNPTPEEKPAMRAYKYDPEFKEECWAVGKSIEHIIKVNRHYLDSTNEKLVALKEVLSEMTSTSLTLRITIEEALLKVRKINGKGIRLI